MFGVAVRALQKRERERERERKKRERGGRGGAHVHEERERIVSTRDGINVAAPRRSDIYPI